MFKMEPESKKIDPYCVIFYILYCLSSSITKGASGQKLKTYVFHIVGIRVLRFLTSRKNDWQK